ncbi:MAG TPA: hypothetical protein PKO33_04410, partial [Pyrinomonadaceae bacterium]|nr:hypothetical protein [Pyrinomonadaceae bacterium]
LSYSGESVQNDPASRTGDDITDHENFHKLNPRKKQKSKSSFTLGNYIGSTILSTEEYHDGRSDGKIEPVFYRWVT